MLLHHTPASITLLAIMATSGCAKPMPANKSAFLAIKKRMDSATLSPEETQKFKAGDLATRSTAIYIFFVKPVQDEGYDFNETVRTFCNIATINTSNESNEITATMLTIWKEYADVLLENKSISKETYHSLLSQKVKDAITRSTPAA